MNKEYWKTVIQNANDVLLSPMTYPTFAQYKQFHTNELNTRSMWAERKASAIKKLKDLKDAN